MYNGDEYTLNYILKSLSTEEMKDLVKSAPPGTIPVKKIVNKQGMAPFQQTFYTAPQKPDEPKKPKMSYTDAAKQAEKFRSGFKNNEKFFEACKTMGLSWTENRYEDENMKGAQHALTTAIQHGMNPYVALKLGVSKQVAKTHQDKIAAERKEAERREAEERKQRELEEHNKRMKQKWAERQKQWEEEEAAEKLKKESPKESEPAKSVKVTKCTNYGQERQFFDYQSNFLDWAKSLSKDEDRLLSDIMNRNKKDTILWALNAAVTGYNNYGAAPPEVTRTVDKAISRFQLNSPVQVETFVDSDTFWKIHEAFKKQKSYVERGYMRSYVSPPTNEEVRKKNRKQAAKLVIDVPAGKGYGAWLSSRFRPVKFRDTPDENRQFLLAHGLKFQVESISDMYSGQPTVKLKIIDK